VAATIVWFRNDLRIRDNRALIAALQRGGPVIPLFVWAPEEDGIWQLGSASRWWLRQSLIALDQDLIARGSKLIVRSGQTSAVLKSLARETEADAVYFSRQYESQAVERDRDVTIELQRAGIAAESFIASLLIEPWEIKNSSGKPFRVFTHYWNRCVRQLDTAMIDPIEEPATISRTPRPVDSISLESLDLHLDSQRSAGFEANWHPGAASAEAKLETFLHDRLHAYAEARDSLSLGANSCMSPHLHFGEISPRQIWNAVTSLSRKSRKSNFSEACTSYLRQLGWREFAYHLIYHFPETTFRPLQMKFASFPWCNDERLLKCWKEGRTGYPIVDAGMRQLLQTGWINNRMRMIVASFLVKDLLLPWQEGARWFWETLVDADLANNTLGWQWVAGCGADAAPFFRIFNPVSQGEKFDPDGEYTRRWLPELHRLPRKFIHRPWVAPQSELDAAGITIGTTYPHPIVDHDMARQRALDRFRALRKETTSLQIEGT
jgi:deoxyribodipyrimidine photo-lyase